MESKMTRLASTIPVTVGDFPACFVDLIDRTGEYYQASIGYNIETQLDVWQRSVQIWVGVPFGGERWGFGGL